jgi:plasmid maintenance system antidote protein VapI
MYKTVQLLNMLKAFKNLPSDYAVAHFLDVSTQSVSQYRCNKTFCSDNVALKLAHHLGLNPLVVLASVNLERAERIGDESLILFWSKYAMGGA